MRLQPVELDWASVDPLPLLPDEVDVCFDDSPAEFEKCFPTFDVPEVDGEVLESFEFVAEVLEVLKEKSESIGLSYSNKVTHFNPKLLMFQM